MKFVDRITEPDIRSVFEYWLQKRRDTAIPLKRDIDPAELSHRVLPWLFMYKQEPGGRLRCILSGTGIAKIDEVDATGRYLDEVVPPHALESRIRLFTSTLEQARPTYYQGRYAVAGRASRGFSRLLLPISAAGDKPDCVFGIVHFRRPGPMNAQEERVHPGEPSVVIQATPDDLDPSARDLLSV